MLIYTSGCPGDTQLSAAITGYREHRDYASLAVITHQLSKELYRKDVEALLGEAGYSPTDGV